MKMLLTNVSVILLLLGYCSAAPQATENVAGFILYKNEGNMIEYLFLQKGSELDDWSPPKGKMDMDEDEIIAAIRETFEETGFIETDYVSFPEKKIYFEYTTNDGDLKKVTLFPAKFTNLMKRVTIDPNEHAAYEWLGFPAGQWLIKPQYLEALEEANVFIMNQEGF